MFSDQDWHAATGDWRVHQTPGQGGLSAALSLARTVHTRLQTCTQPTDMPKGRTWRSWPASGSSPPPRRQRSCCQQDRAASGLAGLQLCPRHWVSACRNRFSGRSCNDALLLRAHCIQHAQGTSGAEASMHLVMIILCRYAMPPCMCPPCSSSDRPVPYFSSVGRPADREYVTEQGLTSLQSARGPQSGLS